jgi:glycine dehydrogenase subunit 1
MRYLPITDGQKSEMLDQIGVSNVDELYSDIPKHIIDGSEYNLPDHKGEIEVEKILSKYANNNISARNSAFFLGAGCYNHHVPSTVDYIIQRSEFLTSYTPYQPEIAQGTLSVIFEFQTMIANITGQEVANASMYDGATSTAEAALMALRVNKKRNKIKIANDIHPHYEEVVKTYLRNYEEIEISHSNDLCDDTACVIIQTPDFYGQAHNISELRKKCDETGALLIVVVSEIFSLGLLPAPKEADIVVGEAQSVGVAMSFGGPHLGFFACRKKYVRQMPGRLCGITHDKDDKKSFVLTLNTREQHIRREKATSNICTNQGLMALAFTVHMSLLGEVGFKKVAKINHYNCCKLVDSISKIKGVKVETDNFFNEVTIALPENIDSKKLVKDLSEDSIIAGYPVDGNKIVLAATELTTDEDIQKLAEGFDKAINNK